MIRLFLLSLVLFCVSSALAGGFEGNREIKSGAGTGAASDVAVVNSLPKEVFVYIGSLPYVTTGNTCQFIDQFDAVCPYTGSTSPDVVYSFTPGADVDVGIDLCGSSYDTKVYVLDPDLNIVGCNDDFYFDSECGVYASFLTVQLFAEVEYWLVVEPSSYSPSSSVTIFDYILEICGHVSEIVPNDDATWGDVKSLFR